MRVKKHNGKAYGAEFTTAEKEAITKEINRQIAEANEKNMANIDAVVLYTLHAHYGWGKKRLRKFWEAFSAENRDLCEWYNMTAPQDNVYLAHRKLQEIGVDVREWYKEEAETP